MPLKEVSMSYSTGEIAELCGVTVRTVQYYDREGLNPKGFPREEGGFTAKKALKRCT